MRIFLLFTFILFWSFVTGQNITPDQLTTSTGILGRSSGTGPVNILDASTTKTFLSLNNVENTALSTWGGSTNIVTVGNITSGTWNGTTIAIGKGGTGLTALGSSLQVLRTNPGATAMEWATLSDNNGIYTGSGNIPDGTTATAIGDFTVDYNTGTDPAIIVSTTNASLNLSSSDGNAVVNLLNGDRVEIGYATEGINVTAAGVEITDPAVVGGAASDASAVLTLISTNKGFLPPRMTTTERNAIGTPTNGLLLYNTTTNKLTLRENGSWVELGTGGGSGDISNGGNTTGAAITLGTNDAFGLNLETNNTTRFSISGGSSTGGAIVSTDVSANTNSVEIMTTKIVNSTGVAATGFGNETLYQLETSTTNSQDAAAIDVLWSDATHATRTSDIVFRTVASGTALSEAMRIGGTDYKLTLSSTTSNTNTAVDRVLIQTNSTGTPTSSFGGQIKFIGKSSTTNNRDMGSVGATWTTATDASRTSAIIFKGVNNAGTMDEIARFEGAASPVLKIASSVGTAGTTTFSNSGITPGVTFTIGGNTNIITVGGSSGSINISSSAVSTTAISISASDNSGTINLGNTAYTSTSLSKTNLKVTDSYTAASGSGSYIAFEIAPTFNLTSTVTGVQRGIYINPTITSLANSSTFRAIDISNNNSSSFGVYQSGTSTKNIFAGKNAFGSTTAATEVMEITGNSKTTGQYWSALYTLTDAATIALDWNNGNVQTVTLGGNRTFTFANPKGGARYSIIIKQDATGSRTITWPTIKWAGGTTPTLTTTANKYDIVTFIYDGTSYFGTISTNF